ncbi:macrophage mannose receptor 1 isoform X2 [Paralichthys olivaceus]
MEDMERLTAAAPGHEGDVWIGRYDRPWRWWWSAQDHSLNTNNEQHFHVWRAGQPNVKRYVKHVCVSVLDGFWFDNRCSFQLPFVCYDKKNLHDLPNISIQRYVYVNDKTSWNQAQAYCRLHHTDLASVRNATENALIQKSVPSGQRASIGLFRNPFFDNSEGTRSSFGNWIEGRPEVVGTGSCVISRIGDRHHGKWMEKPCDARFHFMCQRKEKHLFYIKVKVLKSTINLNDPDVTDAILNMIKETLKKRGMTKGFQAAWIKKPDENIFHKEEEN